MLRSDTPKARSGISLALRLHRPLGVRSKSSTHRSRNLVPDSEKSAPNRRICSGGGHECRLVFAKPFQHIAFGLRSRFHEDVVLFVPPLAQSWFESIRPIGHAVTSYRCENVFVESQSGLGAAPAQYGNH